MKVNTDFARAATPPSAPETLLKSVKLTNPDNPRHTIRDVEGLADSFTSIGQITPVNIASIEAYLRDRPHRAGELLEGAHYVLVDGHRRLAAARLAGLPTVRVVHDDALVSSDERLLEAAFVANAQREGMTELEEAQALKLLVEHYGSQGKAAKQLGLTQGGISQRLSLLNLSPELQSDLVEGRRAVKHVRSLATLPFEEQKAKADARAEQERQEAAEKKLRKNRAPAAPTPSAPPAEADTHYPVMGAAQEPPPTVVPGQRPTGATPAGSPQDQDQATAARTTQPLDWGDHESVFAHLTANLDRAAQQKLSIRLINHLSEKANS